MCAEQNDLRIGAQAKISEQADRRTRGTTDGKRKFTMDSNDDTEKEESPQRKAGKKKRILPRMARMTRREKNKTTLKVLAKSLT
jgi:hypothetical protein